MDSSIKICKLIEKEWLHFFFGMWNLGMLKSYDKITSCNPLFINMHLLHGFPQPTLEWIKNRALVVWLILYENADLWWKCLAKIHRST